MGIEPTIKYFLGFDEKTDDETVLKEWKRRTDSICKPCWEIKYCPYGVLVEQFPLPTITRSSAIEHDERLKLILKRGKFESGKLLNETKRKDLERMVEKFNEENYPEELPEYNFESACSEFGHFCPVFFVYEFITETTEIRREGRYIPFKTKIRVARRDNYTCQICGKTLRDNELEFDHIIPLSKGGSSEEHNIQLACFDCNRNKSTSMEL